MKKLIIPIMMLLPIMVQAQSVLTPQQQLEQAQKQLEEAKKAVEAAKKAKQAAEEAARNAAENAKIQEQTKAMQEEAARLNAEAEKIKAETQKNQAEAEKAKTEVQKQSADSNKGWEVPKTAPVTKVEKKTATNANGDVLKDDPKYLSDALTYDGNGKIVFTLTTDADGKSAAQIYDLVYGYMNGLTQGENNIASKVALVNKGENIIANTMDEWLVFSNSFISLDRTEFKYTLIATIKDNSLQVTLGRINYNYEAGRSTGFKDTAENVISDKMALNRKKTALAKIYGKFRRCTIDRKDQIFKDLTTLVKQ